MRWTRITIRLAPFVIGLVIGPPAAQPQIPSGDAEAAERGAMVTRLLGDFQRASDTPGLALAVARHGRIELTVDLGFADVEQSVAVTQTTRFRIGSLSKALTAALMMELIEQEALDLDAPITTVLPSLPERYAAVTPRRLAGHLAGIRHYEDGESTNPLPIRGTQASLARFVDDPLLHPPGTAYEYSSYGYVLLGAVLETVCQRAYEVCLRQEILDPLGLDSITADYPERIVPHRTRFYSRTREGVENASYSDRIYKLAAGGFLSSVVDLARFGSSLLEGELLESESVELLFTSQTTTSGEPTGYGMGFRPAEDWSGRAVVHHGGSAEGGRAFLMLYPEERLVLAFAANLGGAPFFQQEAWTIASLWLEGTGTSLPPAERHSFDGVYTVRAGDLDTGDDSEEDLVAGTLHLHSGAEDDPGVLVLDGDPPTPIFLSVMRERAGRLWVAGSGRHGMLNLWLTARDGRFEGRWNWFGKTAPIEIVRR